MTNINRRNVLQSLAASTVFAGAVPGKEGQARTLGADPNSNDENDLWRGAWLIARQDQPPSGRHIVDFWTNAYSSAWISLK